MKYRSFSREDVSLVRDAILNNESFDIDKLGTEIGDGELIDLAKIKDIGDQAINLCKSGKNPEVVELSLSGDMYLCLRHLPVKIRDDSGFWRWVTVAALMSFLLVRDSTSKKPIGTEAIGSGTNASDILACRMFLRGQVARRILSNGDLDFSLVTELGVKNHDFWQSHVLRVSTGSERNLALALIDSHKDNKLSTNDLRPFVRDRINRPKTTLATFLMSSEEAETYIERQRDIFSSEGSSDDFE